MIFHAKFLEHMHWLVAVLLAITACVLFGLAMCGCSAPARVLSSVEMAERVLPINAELDVCRIEAKKLPEGQQMNFYKTCETEAVRKTCARITAAERAAWARCQQVTP